jgi:hypothetical protein
MRYGRSSHRTVSGLPPCQTGSTELNFYIPILCPAKLSQCSTKRRGFIRPVSLVGSYQTYDSLLRRRLLRSSHERPCCQGASSCLCPRNDESAGKRRSNRVRKGAVWLKATLIQCAWAAVKKKDSYLQAQFVRITARRGKKKAILAVAASMLTAIYHMLKDGTLYQDLGRNYFDRRSTDQQKKRLVKRLADLGYAVELTPLPA